MARIRTIKNLKKKAWSLCSRFIRRKYADSTGYCTCYTCGKKIPWSAPRGHGAEAGHGFSGRGNSILLEEDIIRPQCYGCNCMNSGKLDIFSYKLRQELGEVRYDELYKQKFISKSFTVDELEQIINMYELKIKALGD